MLKTEVYIFYDGVFVHSAIIAKGVKKYKFKEHDHSYYSAVLIPIEKVNYSKYLQKLKWYHKYLLQNRKKKNKKTLKIENKIRR